VLFVAGRSPRMFESDLAYHIKHNSGPATITCIPISRNTHHTLR
jgi:hypothetical protein